MVAFLSALPGYLVTLAVIAATTTLAAMGHVDGQTAIAVIAGLGGLHIGVAAASPSPAPPAKPSGPPVA